jgi:peptidoglycan/LPS O-acetylase OafA/YrhL
MDYRPKLDGLRGVAIVMLLLGHYLYLGGQISGVYGVNLFLC